MSRPGRLNRRVEVWRDTGTTVNSLGEKEETWTMMGDRSASLDAAKGSETFREESVRESQPVVIDVRYDELTKTLGPVDWLRYNDGDGVVHDYDIQSASDRFGDHRYIRINALVRGPEASRLPAP